MNLGRLLAPVKSRVMPTSLHQKSALSSVAMISSSSVPSNQGNSSEVTAGIIIIGDEILKGQTKDTNTSFLAEKLHSFGIKLSRVSVIPDDIDIIAEEVGKFSKTYHVVLTSGGIGPTHDDVTFEGVAKAFDDVTEPHPKIVDFVKTWFKTDNPNAPALKLAQIPSKAKLNFGVDKITGREIRFPIVSVENVFVFPGIPDLLQRAFNNLGEELIGSLSKNKFFVKEVFVPEHETSIADSLNQLVSRYPRVQFGSYPEWIHNYYKTKLTIESTDPDLAQEVEAEVKKVIPTMAFDKNPRADAFDKIQNLFLSSKDEQFKAMGQEAIATIRKCFQEHGTENTIACFNGGKDCIVMLHLAFAVMQQDHPGVKLKALYIKERDPFPEVEKFILDTEAAYDLEALNFDGPMKKALQSLLESRPNIKAALLGTRKGDPGSHNQDLFSPTDGDWPKLMRVNPVLNWDYSHIWTFIRGLSLLYPSLYDQGYTSLGSVANTAKNPALRYLDEEGKEHFKPAYELKDGGREREGRKTSYV